ncbi:NAD-dependent epimerase [Acrocarpospora phusangensis]|uniref:NAD-dependent epimerase n=1 Tax=Acrocarpospora phusangensis TaxID=1070424 RepID=A0A919QF44_9ACTN|nr:NAD-dependent epimerase/dehydratase family protein [Acrocarpospora phusangensis]GIH27701.1 NAD-dependent epimerase [Acrocarpospora phusangensis]
MRVVVVGASGNVGTSVVSALAADPDVSSIIAVARRQPGWYPPKTSWRTLDVTTGDLVPHLAGADAVVHLAWLFQPTRDRATTWRNNVLGSLRLFEAVARAEVPALVYASSVGAYSPGVDDLPVTEEWPTHAWPTAAYGCEKSYVERLLDIFERDHPTIRVVRLRPGFTFKRTSATEQRRLFAGPFLPNRLVRPGMIPFVPDTPGFRLQAVHTDDVAEAYRLAITQRVSGAFNIAAGPVIEPHLLADILGARLIPVPRGILRNAVAAAWHLRLIPASPGLVDLTLRLPVMDTSRAHDELGWVPAYTAVEALLELLEGMRTAADLDTPPLSARTSGPARIRELQSGPGRRP